MNQNKALSLVELSGKQSCFTTLLIDKSDGHFAGSGKNSVSGELPSVVEGHITADRIIFSYEDRDGSFSAIFKDHGIQNRSNSAARGKRRVQVNRKCAENRLWSLSGHTVCQLRAGGVSRC